MIARITAFRKIDRVIDLYIFYISIGLEIFTGAICAQIGPLIKMPSSFKVGSC